MNEYLTTEDLANLLAVPARTVEDWRRTGKGPRHFKIGKHVRYCRTDIDAWVKERYVH